MMIYIIAAVAAMLVSALVYLVWPKKGAKEDIPSVEVIQSPKRRGGKFSVYGKRFRKIY